MADFGANFEWVWLGAGVPLTAAFFLLIAAVAGIVALLAKAPRARRVALRAAVLALLSPIFPLIPFVLLESGVKPDYSWVVLLFWLWLAFFIGGWWWLALSLRRTRQPAV